MGAAFYRVAIVNLKGCDVIKQTAMQLCKKTTRELRLTGGLGFGKHILTTLLSGWLLGVAYEPRRRFRPVRCPVAALSPVQGQVEVHHR